MRDKTKRRGVTAVMRIAEQRIYDLAEKNLSPSRYKELCAASRKGAYVAGNVPKTNWEKSVGFVPDPEFHYEVYVGIGVEEGEIPNIFARALISRDGEEDYCHIVWEPNNGT